LSQQIFFQHLNLHLLTLPADLADANVFSSAGLSVI